MALRDDTSPSAGPRRVARRSVTAILRRGEREREESIDRSATAAAPFLVAGMTPAGQRTASRPSARHASYTRAAKALWRACSAQTSVTVLRPVTCVHSITLHYIAQTSATVLRPVTYVHSITLYYIAQTSATVLRPVTCARARARAPRRHRPRHSACVCVCVVTASSRRPDLPPSLGRRRRLAARLSPPRAAPHCNVHYPTITLHYTPPLEQRRDHHNHRWSDRAPSDPSDHVL